MAFAKSRKGCDKEGKKPWGYGQKTICALEPIAKELGCTPAQFSLAWCAKNEHVSSVITGASRVEQVHENMQALEVLPKLTEDVMKRVDEIVGKPENEE